MIPCTTPSPRGTDPSLAALDAGLLSEEVAEAARDWDADRVLVFDSTGITGHPDHIAATGFAVQAAIGLGLPVLARTLPAAVATALNSELGTGFVGRPDTEIDVVSTVDRRPQREAVRAHPSQAVPTSALWRRLELLGDHENLRELAGPSAR